MFVILIVLGVFLLWLGIALRKIHRGYASLVLIISLLLLVLSTLAFLKII